MSVSLKPQKWLVRDYFQALGERRVAVELEFDPQEGLTRQADKESCDINRIVKQYAHFGVDLPGAPADLFQDVSQGWDYRESLERAAKANEYFGALPSEMRAKYGNDPGVFFDEVFAEENLEDAIALGLVERVVPEVPSEVPANPPA